MIVKQYAAYRGDQLIVTGTLQTVAMSLGIKVKSACWLCSPTAHKRREGSNKALLIYRVED